MAENNRKYSVFLLVLALIGAAVFYGCGGSSSSDPIPAIEYQITGSYTSNGLTSAVTTSGRASSGLAEGILIYSEADPTNYADVDTEKRTYIIKNLKPGTHYIVFKHIPNNLGGTTYICRTSSPVVLTADNPVQTSEKLHAEECTVSITGKITNPNGTPIVPAPVLTLWGQNIEVNTLTGEFTTPKMPEKTKADLIVNAVNYQQTSSPIVFESNPAYFEITAVDTSSNNVPPTINLSSKKSVYNTNANVTFTAVASDLNKDELEFNWQIESCTSANPGFLEKGNETNNNATYTSECYWSAPADDCIATISVTVFEKNTTQKLSAKAKLKIQIGTGHFRPNTIPVITSTEIYPENLYGDRTYTVTCNATDTDGDILTEFLTISPSGGRLDKSGANTWSWRTPDLDTETTYTLTFEVRDPRGNKVNATKTVTVQPSQPNQPPAILSATPAGASNVMSGTTLDMLVEANDPENEKLTFKWEVKKGELVSTSKNNNIASATWKAPFLNADTPTSISCSVKDPYGAEASLTFDITINPDPNRKAPEIDLSISGTTAQYNGMLLFKPEEVARFTGAATDSNSHVAIDESHYTWYLTKPNSSEFEKIETGSNNTSFTVPQSPERGVYTVKMTATDLSNITGEESMDFRVNELPVANILWKISEGNFAHIGTDGRLKNSSNNNICAYDKDNIDVFQYSTEVVASFVASFTDLETTLSVLETNAKWYHGETTSNGKDYNPVMTSSGLNEIKLSTLDSKSEAPLATATYQYYINKAPEFDVATSTKTNYVDNDTVSIKLSVKDDFENFKVAIFVATKTGGGAFSAYAPIAENPTIPSVPEEVSGKTLNKNYDIGVLQLKDLYPGKNIFKFLIIATDSMGLQKTNEDEGKFIQFELQAPHTVNEFKVASGSYNYNSGTSFSKLAEESAPYIFEAKQQFSIQSGCYPADQQGQIEWTWYDAQWNGNTVGAFTAISGNDILDGFTLNGYSIEDKFGTHTIKLEGRHKNTNIIASQSINIFINSTPQVSFVNAASNTMRFDTGAGATFTITLKEDNKDEKLGLTWTLVDLDRTCNPKESTKKIISSNNPITKPIYMDNSKEKVVQMTWNDITADSPYELASGAKRVSVMVYDEYGKAATATVDILVNTLPVFRPVIGERRVKIEVPDSSDNGEDYTYFKEQYATTTANVPVYLVAGNPSMQLNFSTDAYDAEYPDYFDKEENKERIIWRFKEFESTVPGAVASETGRNIKARFGIGMNTIDVECRDSFYNYYSKDGDKTVYNNMCIATYSANFYIWHSYSVELNNVTGNYSGNTLYHMGDNDFYMTYGTFGNGAPFVGRYEINPGVNTLVIPVNKGKEGTYPFRELFVRKPDEKDPSKFTYESTEPTVTKVRIKNADSNCKIITLVRRSEKDFYMLTDCVASDPAGIVASGTPPDVEYIDLYAKYNDNATDKEEYSEKILPYSLYECVDSEDGDPAEGKTYSVELEPGVITLPGDDNHFLDRILSMTYCSDSDETAGAILLRQWDNHGTPRDAIAPYMESRILLFGENNSHPLYFLDNDNLRLENNSKARYLNTLADNNQKLYITDTVNNRLLRLNADFSQANTIPATHPIDVCTTNSKYVFALSDSGDKGLHLYAVDNASATLLTSFGKILTENSTDSNKRAGKLYNPKSIIYYVQPNGNDYFGGLMILEEGMTHKNRIQVIRANKADWLE